MDNDSRIILDLKAAKSLLEEVSSETDVDTIIERRKVASDLSENQFWEGMKALNNLNQEISYYEQKLNQAIDLSKKAKSTNPSISFEDNDNTYTPDSILSGVYLQKGLLKFCQEAYKDSIELFKKSISFQDNALAHYTLAITYSTSRDVEQAANSYQYIIDNYSDSELAVEALKELTFIKSLKIRKWKTALILSILLGMLGIDRFYLGYTKSALWKFFTGGGFYIWWIIDIIKIANNTLKDVNGRTLQK
jgi:tetratricopeptide (TPR) repeat protein